MPRIEMKERLICKECGKEFTKIDCVTRHVKIVHKIEPKTYYDKWFKTETEGKCKCCGAETKYWSLERGYREFCSRKCFWKVTTQLDEVKAKRKQTCKEKYDSENYMQSKDFKEKSENTCVKKYNIKNGGGSKEAVKKIKATKFKNHGDENFNNSKPKKLLSLLNIVKIHCKICGDTFDSYRGLSNHLGRKHDIDTRSYYDRYLKTESDGICKICGKPTQYKNLQFGYRRYCSNECSRKDIEIYEKAQITNKEKYGTACTLANPEVRNKGLQTKKERYGSEYYCNSEKAKQKSEQNTFEKFIKDIKDCEVLSYKNKQLTCRCKLCNSVFTVNESFAYLRHYRYNIPLCTNCFPMMDIQSAKEKQVNEFIKSIYTGAIVENDRTVLDGKELDIYLPDRHLAFELDGLYWHSELYKDKDYHLKKTEACTKKGIQLIHIFEDEWLYKQEIVKSRIKGLLGLNDRIFARKCTVMEVPYKDSERFLDDCHIQGNCMSTYRYGLYYNNELVSLMTFGKSRFADEYELLRFCNRLDTNVVGGASRLFRHFIVEHPEIKRIISFADRRWSVGNLYEKLGFAQTDITPPSYFYIIDNIRHNRFSFQKHRLVAEGFDSGKSEHEIMLERKIYRIYDCGNLKYEYVEE